jgi:redox-sensitive bicupin YhaK (pirin superfamily)
VITIRRSEERGHADHGWLKTHHTFSFASYRDRNHMGYRSLRVINDDQVAPGQGFGLHPHDNMEIASYLVAGALKHQDTAGHAATVRRGGVQFMSAGAGIAHSEVNGSPTEWVHLLQIWIRPAERDTEPRYEDRDFSAALDGGEWVTLLSPDGRGGSIRIGQDAVVLGARPRAGAELRHRPAGSERGLWVQVVSGEVSLNGGEILATGDGASIEGEGEIVLRATADSELLLFDLA